MAHHPSSQDRLRQHLQLAFPSSSAANPPSATEILSSSANPIPYLDAIIAETNRLAATVPLIVRVATVDTHVLGYAVPRGTHIMCNSRVTGPYFDDDDGSLESQRSESSRAAMKKRWMGELGGGGGTGSERRAMRDLERFEPERWLVKRRKRRLEEEREKKVEEIGENIGEEEEEEEVFDANVLPTLAFSAGPRGCFGELLTRFLPFPLPFLPGLSSPSFSFSLHGNRPVMRVAVHFDLPIPFVSRTISRHDVLLLIGNPYHAYRSSTCDAGVEDDDRPSHTQLQVLAVARVVDWDGRPPKGAA